VSVQLRIKLAAGVVVVDGERQVPGRPVLIGASLPHAAGRKSLGFFQGFCDGSAMCFDQPIIAPRIASTETDFGAEIVKS
jgi:hypothetical protein